MNNKYFISGIIKILKSYNSIDINKDIKEQITCCNNLFNNWIIALNPRTKKENDFINEIKKQMNTEIYDILHKKIVE